MGLKESYELVLTQVGFTKIHVTKQSVELGIVFDIETWESSTHELVISVDQDGPRKFSMKPKTQVNAGQVRPASELVRSIQEVLGGYTKPIDPVLDSGLSKRFINTLQLAGFTKSPDDPDRPGIETWNASHAGVDYEISAKPATMTEKGRFILKEYRDGRRLGANEFDHRQLASILRYEKLLPEVVEEDGSMVDLPMLVTFVQRKLNLPDGVKVYDKDLLYIYLTVGHMRYRYNKMYHTVDGMAPSDREWINRFTFEEEEIYFINPSQSRLS
ncbi:hypothetical protein CEW46_29740 [Bacillus cereus]|nr:hypothetical protein CEW46_29740 [Bacillus cereus]